MAELETLIKNWREEMGGQEVLLPENLDELEDHLRSEVMHLGGSGLSAEEAYWIARKRMGDGETLAGEYVKVNYVPVWAQRFSWMIVGVVLYMLWTSMVVLAATSASSVSYYFSNSNNLSLAIYAMLTLLIPIGIYLAIKKQINSGASQSNLFSFAGKFGIRNKIFLVLMFAFLAFRPLLSQLFNLAMINVTGRSAEHFGRFFMGINIWDLGFSILMPLFLGTVLLWLNRKMRWQLG